MDELLINFLRSISLTNNWLILFPEIFLVLVAVILLGVDLFIKNVSQLFRNKFSFLTTLLSQIIA